jgi:hypothetical protein
LTTEALTPPAGRTAPRGRLCRTLRAGQTIDIGDVSVTIRHVRGRQVSLAIEAPPEVRIPRAERAAPQRPAAPPIEDDGEPWSYRGWPAGAAA